MSNPVDPFAPPPDRFPRKYSQFEQHSADDTQEIPVVSPVTPPPIPQGITPPPQAPSAPPPPPQGNSRKRMVAGIIIGGIFLGLIAGGGAAFLVTGGVFDDLVAADDTESTPSSAAEESQFPNPDEDESAEGLDTAPTMPTKLGAWWAREGVYAAKWEEPKDTGGGKVTGYLVTDCESGDELFALAGEDYTEAQAAADNASGVFEVEFKAKDLTCVSVSATNYIGTGEEATFDIEEE